MNFHTVFEKLAKKYSNSEIRKVDPRVILEYKHEKKLTVEKLVVCASMTVPRDMRPSIMKKTKRK